MRRCVLIFCAIALTTGCNQADTSDVDAAFSAFCDEHPFFRYNAECVDQDSVTADKKQEIMDNAPSIDEALENFKENSDVDMKVLEE